MHTNRESRKSLHTYAVGDLLTEEMEERGWSVRDLADAAGLPVTTIESVLAGPPINQTVANGLARAFGTSVELWLNLAGVGLRSVSRR